MYSDCSIHPGWYAVLDFARGPHPAREVVYLFVVPEVGVFMMIHGDEVKEFSCVERGWEWHGPFASPQEASIADLSRDLVDAVTFDL